MAQEPQRVQLAIKNFPAQDNIFKTDVRYTVVPKGRRFGLTKGAANNFIEEAYQGKFKRGLWVDTVNSNIDRYIERYFMPHLRKLPANLWKWEKQNNVLHMHQAYIDFRSADRPECYDQETEILTDEGWKLFSLLTRKEKVLTFNPQTQNCEWQKPSKYVERDYSGKMKHFSNKKIDLLVTPNHRFYVITAHNKGKFKEITKCNSHDRIPARVNFVGEDKKELTHEMCAFIGFYLADGSCDKNKGGYRIIFSKKRGIKGGIKGDVRGDFTSVLDKMGIKYNDNGKDRITILNKKLYEIVSSLGNKYTKYIPTEIKNLPPEKLATLLEWMVKGDGTVRLRKNFTETTYASVSKKLIDDFQEIVIKCGYSGSVRVINKAGDKSVDKNGREWVATTSCYSVTVCSNKYNYFSNGKANFVKDANYTGKVYCVEVENHVVMVRRNGKICWSGNTLEGFGYDKFFINEAGIVLKNEYLWNNAIRPMLWDYNARGVIGGTPKSKGIFNDLYARGKNTESRNYRSLTFTSFDNPYLDRTLLEEEIKDMPERVVLQEVYAQFLDDTGSVFRNVRGVANAVPQEPENGHIYVMGVDLAKVTDFTVLTVYDRNTNCQVYQDRFNKLDYTLQKKKIQVIAKHYKNALVMLDAASMGDPIADDLSRAGVAVEPIKLTNQLKKEMIEKLVIWIEQKKLRILPIEETVSEFTNFTYDITGTGKTRYSAPSGQHDDIVISHALAVWDLGDALAQVSQKEPTMIEKMYDKLVKGRRDEEYYEFDPLASYED